MPDSAAPWTYSPSGSSVHEIPQARILEWVAISFSRGSSWTRDQTHVSCIGRRILYHWVTREAHLTRVRILEPLWLSWHDSMCRHQAMSTSSMILGLSSYPKFKRPVSLNLHTHTKIHLHKGFPWGSVGKESACNVGDLGSITWVGKILWRRERLPTRGFWPGEFHGIHGVQRVGHNWVMYAFTFKGSKRYSVQFQELVWSGVIL